MDAKTLAAYDAGAQAFTKDWHEQPAPVDLHALINRFFKPGPTADIGCGSGREVAWMCANGFPAIGYDPSRRLLAHAHAIYPDLQFAAAALPDLPGIQENTFDNILCETVIMHLPRDLIASSVRRLMSILAPGGILCLGWRVTEGFDQRDRHGRLYTAFDNDLVTREISIDAIILDEEVVSASSGRRVHRIVACKNREIG